MRKAVLYLAMSLDGYLADKQGGVSWLAGESPDQDDMQSYARFIQTVDTVVMGYTTYHQIVTELSPGNWSYAGKTSYVITHRQKPSTDQIIFTAESPSSLVRGLKERDGKDIWICGGASIVNQLHQTGLIDRYHLSIIPTILGDGVRLFEPHDAERKLHLIRTEQYNGIIDLVYEPRS